MWTRKEQISQEDSYVRGRTLAGEVFLDVFTSKHPWLVKEFKFGLSNSHAEKMGQALELIVTCSTKPKARALPKPFWRSLLHRPATGFTRSLIVREG